MMYSKILRRKMLLAFLLFLVLGVFQAIVLNRYTLARLVQFALLDIAILTGVYSFRTFELDTMKSFNALLVAITSGTIIGAAVISLILLLFKNSVSYRLYRIDFFASVIYALIVFPLVVRGYYSLMSEVIPPCKCYVLGSREKFGSIMEEVVRASHGKVIVVEWIEEPQHLELKLVQKNHCDIILVADWKLYQRMKDEVQKWVVKGYQKRFITTTVERWLQRIPFEVLQEFSDYYEPILSDVYQSKRKRVLDLFIAFFFGLIALPLTVLTALLVLVFSGWPIFFNHRRIGLHGTEFSFYKFRSLKEIKQKDLDEMEDPNGSIHQRITLIGRLIRKIRFDEFPQLLNILKGNMSLVGPRPEMVNYHKKYQDQIPYYNYRLYLKPGITGWAQIKFNHTSTLEEYRRKTEYDLYYIKNRNFMMDLQIILMTVETMLGMRGSR